MARKVDTSDLTNRVFGRITVIQKLDKRLNNQTVYLCECMCGTRFESRRQVIANGARKSCGCLRRERMTRINTKHGHWAPPGQGAREYKIWKGMRTRCNNPKASGYRYYGACGIRVCARWDSFEVFLKDMGRIPAGMTSIDRIDNEKGYQHLKGP